MVVPAVDETDWPIVRIRWPEEVTLDDVTILAGILDRIFAKRGAFVTVSDISALSLTATTALHRKRVAEQADRLAEKGALVGEAVVLRNPAVRLLLQGYLWLRAKHANPVQVFDDQAKAEQWARTLVPAMRR